MNIKKILIFSGSTILIATFVAMGFYSYHQKNQKTVQIHYTDIQETIYGLGVARAKNIFDYKIGMSSTLKAAFIQEGDLVKRGQKLLVLENAAPLVAPFPGMVTMFTVHPGENIFPQTTILKIEDFSEQYIEVDLEQFGALRVKKGMKAKVSFESLRSQALWGEVSAILPKDDSFKVFIKLDHLPSEILPGMSADVAIIVGEKKQVKVLPLKAISLGKVVLVHGLSKKKVSVKIGLTDDEWAEILDPEFPEGSQFLIGK